MLTALLPVLALLTAHAAQAAFDGPAASLIMQKALHKKCLHAYTPACFKMDVVALMDKLSAQDSYQVGFSDYFLNLLSHCRKF